MKLIISLVIACFVSSVLADSVIPITMANLKGQKNLFEKGWYIIASPVEALEYAQQNSHSSRDALKKALQLAESLNTNVSLKESFASANKLMQSMNQSGKDSSSSLSKTGDELSQTTSKLRDQQFREAWKKINLGYLHYSQTNHDDLTALKKVNQEFFPNLKQEFKNMDEAVLPVLGSFFAYQDVEWQKYFTEGQYHFNEQYQMSGTRSNSIAGLWDILVGYGKFLYSSVVKTTGHAAMNAAKNSGYYSTNAILRSFIVTHGTIYSLGANMYYSTKLGYRLVSPSVEAGLLSSLALINAATSPVVKGTLKSAGLINKVAVNTVAPVAGAGALTISQLTSKATTAATYLTYGTLGVGEIFFEKLESGIVLGYSALSQLPPQLLLTSVNSAIFLVIDGPKLILMSASGKMAGRNIWELPTGAVMDMKKLKEAGVELVPLSEDPKILKQVLQHAN